MNAISNNDDMIDSREVIERLEELEEMEQTAASDTFGPEELDELTALRALAGEASSAADWEYGATLIRDSYFEDYARELAEDIGAVDPKALWPLRHIDWESAADELRTDYFSVDFDGVTYWVR